MFPSLMKPFNSRPHAEVDLVFGMAEEIGALFQLTTSRRGRLFTRYQKRKAVPFNSRPHAEVDSVGGRVGARTCTFQLTTSRRGRLFLPVTVSVNLFFQLTTSRRGRPVVRNGIDTYATFQLTTSRRGRRVCYLLLGKVMNFQLTTSRRGRLEADDRDTLETTFNSRPHAEVDGRRQGCTPGYGSFNSRPHAEVDINISHILCKISILFLIFFTKTTLNKAQKYEYYFIFAKINC